MLKRIGAVAVVAAASLTPLVSGALPAEAAPGWVCTLAGGGDKGATGVECHNKDGLIGITYYDDEDMVSIVDRHGTSSKSAIGYLEVAGSGTATFKGQGRYPQHFTEGKKVRVKVCTSNASNRYCSPWSRYGRT